MQIAAKVLTVSIMVTFSGAVVLTVHAEQTTPAQANTLRRAVITHKSGVEVQGDTLFQAASVAVHILGHAAWASKLVVKAKPATLDTRVRTKATIRLSSSIQKHARAQQSWPTR